jgi:dephospho-CoA kinase
MLAERETDRVVVMDIPLLTENPPRDGLPARIVVDVPSGAGRAARERTAASTRRTTPRSHRAPILAGGPTELATHVIDNSGDVDALVPQVDALWADLRALPQLPRDWDFRSPSRARARRRHRPDAAAGRRAWPEMGT